MKKVTLFSLIFSLLFVACGFNAAEKNGDQNQPTVQIKDCNDLGCPNGGTCNSQYGICEITEEKTVVKKCVADEECDEGTCNTDTGICIKTETVTETVTVEKTVAKKCTANEECGEGVCDIDTGLCIKTETVTETVTVEKTVKEPRLTLVLIPGKVTTTTAEVYWTIRNSANGTIQNFTVDCDSDTGNGPKHFEISDTAGASNLIKFEGLTTFSSYRCLGTGIELATGTTVSDEAWFFTKYEEPVMTYCTYNAGDEFPDTQGTMGLEITSPLWSDGNEIPQGSKNVPVAKFNIKNTLASYAEIRINRMRFTAVNNGAKTEEQYFNLTDSIGKTLAVNPPPIEPELIDLTLTNRYPISHGNTDSFTITMPTPGLKGQMTLYLERVEYTDGWGADCVTVFKGAARKNWTVNFAL